MPRLMTSLAAVCVAAAAALAQPADQPQGPADTAFIQVEQEAGYRGFERGVLADYGKAVAGDAKAQTRVMSACEAAIAKDATNAEAIAWRGATKMLQAGAASEAGDFMQAMNHVNAALADISRARELEPANPSVRLVAAQSLLNLALNHPIENMAKGYAKQGIEDATAGLEPLYAQWSRQPARVKGQIMLGVAQAYGVLGKTRNARDWYNRVIGAVPGTEWAAEAQTWIDAADRKADEL